MKADWKMGLYYVAIAALAVYLVNHSKTLNALILQTPGGPNLP